MYYENRPMIWSYDFMYIKIPKYVLCESQRIYGYKCTMKIFYYEYLFVYRTQFLTVLFISNNRVATYQTHASKDGNTHGFHTHVFNKEIK